MPPKLSERAQYSLPKYSLPKVKLRGPNKATGKPHPDYNDRKMNLSSPKPTGKTTVAVRPETVPKNTRSLSPANKAQIADAVKRTPPANRGRTPGNMPSTPKSYPNVKTSNPPSAKPAAPSAASSTSSPAAPSAPKKAAPAKKYAPAPHATPAANAVKAKAADKNAEWRRAQLTGQGDNYDATKKTFRRSGRR